MLSSCTNSPKDKVSSMIEDEIKKSLYHAATYESVETIVDSAFAPFDDPAFYNNTVELCKLSIAIDKFDRESEDEKSTMAIYNGSYQTSFALNEYREAKKEYNIAIANKTKAEEEEAKDLAEKLKADIEQGKKFIGFKAYHRYRANTNAGMNAFGNALFIFNKDMSHIIAVYDIDGKEFKAVQTAYKQMKGESTMTDNISLD